MADDIEVDDPEEMDDDVQVDPRMRERGKDLSTKPAIKKHLLALYSEIEKGFRDQWERANEQMDFWDIYNCKLTGKQFYSGNSKIFVPIVHNAVNARKTRFTNQIFPQSGRYVEVTASDGTQPDSITALLESYVRKAKLRTKVMPALMRNGDVEGQYNIYVSWAKTERHVTWKTQSQPLMDGGDGSSIPNPAMEPVEDIADEEVTTQHPDVEVLSDTDVLLLPQTADTVDEALAAGGSATIMRRWGKAKIQALIEEGAIRKDVGEELIEAMSQKSDPGIVNKDKKMVDAAGIKGDEVKHALVYEVWSLVRTAKGEKRICQTFFGGPEKILGCRRNPNWSDRVPLLSVPVEKVAGAFKGQSKIKPCADLQYAANDAINEAWDSAAYALMPIVMTDPEKNPRVGSMVLSLAAVWETSPADTQFAQFPALWEQGFALVNNCKAEISQTLSVNPSMITSGGGGSADSKKNQAELAQEMQVDLLTTADAVTVVEEGILTPMLNLFLELDHQYRDEDLTVRQYGELGVQAKMEAIPPVQMENHYVFRWFGVEQARSAQQVQNQIAGMNVIRGIPPQQMNGYTINLVPIITQLVENTFGPRLAPLIFIPPEDQLPVPVEQENMLMAQGFEVPTHQQDDDQQHIQAHMALLQQLAMGGDTKNNTKIQAHIFKHVQQAQMKMQAMMQAQAQGAPGIPGGQGPGGPQPAPGVAGTPRQGAQPGQPRNQGPPGMIHKDQLHDPSVMPRKVG